MNPSEFLEKKGVRKPTYEAVRLVGNDFDEFTVCGLLDEFADIEVNDEAKRMKLEMLNDMFNNRTIDRENYNYYYQKYCK